MTELDQTDRHLLSLLQANARENAANLARKLGIARTTVVARLARLERDGVTTSPALFRRALPITLVSMAAIVSLVIVKPF